MKKKLITALFFALVMLLCFALISCGDAVQENGKEQTEECTEKPSEVFDGNVLITYDGSNIREEIVEYMKSMALLEWKPKTTFSLTADNGSWGVDLTFEAGESYRGLPYTRGFCDLEGFAVYMENGVYTGPSGDYQTMPGNNCSSACDISWRRYLLSTVSGTYSYVPGSSSLTLMPVGDYAYPEKNSDTFSVIGANKPDVIYEAYSKCKPADAVVKWSDADAAGHARMVTASAVVERNGQGRINANRSYLVLTDQTNKLKADSSGLQTTWNVDKKYSFADLAADGYIPVTHSVFADGETEEPYISCTNGNTADDLLLGFKGIVKSNYAMSKIELEVFDKNGDTVRRHTLSVKNGVGELSLAQFEKKVDLSTLSAGEYTYNITVYTYCMGEYELCSFEFEKQ